MTPTPPSGSVIDCDVRGGDVGIQAVSGQVIENVTIRNCDGFGIDADGASNVTVRNVVLESNGSNIRFHQASGGRLENSQLTNTGGNPEADEFAQQVSIDKSDNIVIIGNVLRCLSRSVCGQEDAIGVYMSDNVLVQDNDISGGNSDSGCGVLLDQGTSNVRVIGNTISNQVNCGIGVANGTDHLIDGNFVAASYGNVGIYVWNQYGGTCARITVSNNTVGGTNPWWSGDNCSPLTVIGNNFEE